MQSLTLQECQQEALKVLIKFDEICKKNNFKYFLIYGTLIGAIRHNGFIPWDDDLDVMMPREDFDKFVRYAKDNAKGLLPFKLCDRSNTENYCYGIPRFSNLEFNMLTAHLSLIYIGLLELPVKLHPFRVIELRVPAVVPSFT